MDHGDEADQAAGAASDYQTAQDAYDGFLTQTQSNLNNAGAATGAINTASTPTGSVNHISITTGGTPDCAAADIAGAVNAAIDQLNAILTNLLAAVNNGNPQHIKDALTALQATGQGFKDQMPAAADNEAAKAAAYAQLDGMF